MNNKQREMSNEGWPGPRNQVPRKKPGFLSTVYLLLLVAVLAAVLWLANALERGRQEFLHQGETTNPEGERLTFSPPGGVYDHNLLLSIRPSDRPDRSHRHAQIIFATGGHVPTLTVGTLYERPLLLDASVPSVVVVRARKVTNGVIGPVVSASYVVGVESALPILSIVADPPDLWDAERGILVNTWRRGREWERPVHVTYVDGNSGSGFEIPAGLRIHGSRRSDEPKRSFRLYFRNDYGAARLEYPLFSDHPYQDVQSYKRLLLQAGDRAGRWTLLDDQLLSDVAAEAGGRVAQGRFVLLFLNGEPWGIYRLSERIDRFFLEDNFGFRSVDLIRNGDVEEGDGQHWDALMDWLAIHDLADEANYAYIQTQIDVDDFTDYAILQMYFGFPADRFSAARPRVVGHWFWLYGGGLQQPGSGTGFALRGNLEPTLLRPSDDPDDLGLLLRSLLDNQVYRGRFVSRVADLLNTALAPATVESHVDRLAASLRPDIAYETARWSAPTDWEHNLAALHDLVQHRPDLLRQQIAHELGLRGTADLTFDVFPDGGGTIFDGMSTATYPWSGVYFLDTEVQAIAVPASGYVFAGWEDGPAEIATTLITVTVDEPRTLRARFAPAPEDEQVLRPNDVIINEYWINDNATRYATVGNRPIEGDWLELLVTCPHTVDLRGWRITDNDTKTGTSEGSIILPQLEALAAVERGTVILIIVTESNANAAYFGQDDMDARDGQMVFYVGNGNLDVTTDPGFGIGTGDDNLVLLSPGPTSTFADDVGVDFVAEGGIVTPLSFGVLADGVTFETPFRGLGPDDGVLFTQRTNNDDGTVGWIADPPAHQSGDEVSLDATNILTPGALNYRQDRPVLRLDAVWLFLAGLIIVMAALYLRARRDQSDVRKTSGR